MSTFATSVAISLCCFLAANMLSKFCIVYYFRLNKIFSVKYHPYLADKPEESIRNKVCLLNQYRPMPCFSLWKLFRLHLKQKYKYQMIMSQ